MVRHAGARPKRIPVHVATKSVKPKTRISKLRSNHRSPPEESIPTRNALAQRAKTTATMALTIERSKLSVTSSLIRRPRPEPIARRMDTSCWRRVARANNRLATLLHAMSNTTATTPINTNSAGR